MLNLLFRFLAVATIVGLLSACAPPLTAPVPGNLSLDVRRLQASLDGQEQSIQKLALQVTELDKRLQQQGEEIAWLRQAPQSGQAGRQPAWTQQNQGTSAAAMQEDGSPTEVYLQAFGDYASGRYQVATHGFETFLQRFPNNGYASNAQFWLGDCYFNQQQYASAIREFEQVLNNYPSAPKSPDALLKIAVAQLQLGAAAEARQTIETLRQRYPKSTATQKAQELAIP
jgi:tol-pal system protein YbgF